MSFSLRVLIVEDVRMEAELVQRALKIFETIIGAPEIIITNTFAAAVTIVQSSHPADIVILDPGLDDSTMHQTIANVLQIENISPTFILTGHSKVEVEHLLHKAHAEHIDVVEKGPQIFEQGFLTGVVATVISKWHARRHKPLSEALIILEGYKRQSE